MIRSTILEILLCSIGKPSINTMSKWKTSSTLSLLLSFVALFLLAVGAWSKQAIVAISSSVITDYSASASASIAVANGYPECQNSCLWKTGINGTWVQDFNFAQDLDSIKYRGSLKKDLIKNGLLVRFDRRTMLHIHGELVGNGSVLMAETTIIVKSISLR